jgi:UDP-galactopyranose mutase
VSSAPGAAAPRSPRKDRDLLFYSAWPLGFHNPEAERKAMAFAEHGYRVVYIAGIGLRNPRLSGLPKLRDRIGRALPTVGHRSRSLRPRLDEAALLVLPPRQLAPLRRLNTVWVKRQLRRALPDLTATLAWVRWPTPELVGALADSRPAVTVYECVDPYHDTPGVTGRWRERYERAERALVRQSAAVVVPGEVLADRFRAWGAEVHVIPHGVELFPWTPRPPSTREPVLGFVGTLDHRIDVGLICQLAAARPDWRFRLIGPLGPGFDSQPLRGLANVQVEPPVPHDKLGETLAGFDLGLMPYARIAEFEAMTPLKALEMLAAGLPAVARRNPELARHGDLIRFAEDPDDFVSQIEAALAEDTPELSERRRAVAEARDWQVSLRRVVALADELLARAGRG